MWAIDERDIYEMEFLVEYKSRQRGIPSAALPVPNMRSIAQDVLDDVTASATVRTYMGDNLRAYISDKRIREKNGSSFLVLLFATSDKRRPDGVVTDPFSSSRREDRKQGNEGADHSCHIVIALEPRLKGGRRYRVSVEQVPNIPFSLVGRYLKAMLIQLSREKEYKVDDPSGVKEGGKFKQVKVKLHSEFASVPSDEMVRSLEAGQLGGIELSREMPGIAAFDEKSYTTDKREKLTLALKKTRVENAPVLDVLRSVMKSASDKHYKTASVKWKTSGSTRSAQFDCETAQPIEKRYMKKKTVGLLNRLAASSESIDDHLSEVMMSWISSQ
jgi:hypothetical protein